MENEENKEVQVEEAPKPIRPKKRSRSLGFEATEVKESPIVEPAPEPTPEPEPENEPTPPAPTPEPVPVRSEPVAKAPEPPKPAAKPAPAVSRRKPRVARPLKGKPSEGTQRGIRYRG